jgi:hypothetical protein
MQRRALLSFAFAGTVAAGVIWRRPLLNAWKETRYRSRIMAIPMGAERAEVVRTLAQLKQPFYTEVEEKNGEVCFTLRLVKERTVTGPWESSWGNSIRWTFKFDADNRLSGVEETSAGWASAT